MSGQQARSTHIPWRGNLFKDKDRAAWDIFNINKVLEQGSNPRASIEVVLRSLNTVRRCVESASSSAAEMRVILDHPSMIPVLYYWLSNRVEPGPSGARLREHVVFTFINLLGFHRNTDELIVFDERFLKDVVAALAVDENPQVAVGVAQLIRRISELDHIAGVICFTDDVLSAVIEGLSISLEAQEINCATHYLSAFINLTSNEKAQFCLARNNELLGVLFATIKEATSSGRTECIKLAIFAGKCIANLLYFPENVSTIRLGHPDLIMLFVECVRMGEELLSDQDCAALGTVAAIALDYCHDKSVDALETDMVVAMNQSPTSQRFVDSTLTKNTGRRNLDLN